MINQKLYSENFTIENSTNKNLKFPNHNLNQNLIENNFNSNTDKINNNPNYNNNNLNTNYYNPNFNNYFNLVTIKISKNDLNSNEEINYPINNKNLNSNNHNNDQSKNNNNKFGINPNKNLEQNYVNKKTFINNLVESSNFGNFKNNTNLNSQNNIQYQAFAKGFIQNNLKNIVGSSQYIKNSCEISDILTHNPNKQINKNDNDMSPKTPNLNDDNILKKNKYDSKIIKLDSQNKIDPTDIYSNKPLNERKNLILFSNNKQIIKPDLTFTEKDFNLKDLSENKLYQLKKKIFTKNESLNKTTNNLLEKSLYNDNIKHHKDNNFKNSSLNSINIGNFITQKDKKNEMNEYNYKLKNISGYLNSVNGSSFENTENKIENFNDNFKIKELSSNNFNSPNNNNLPEEINIDVNNVFSLDFFSQTENINNNISNKNINNGINLNNSNEIKCKDGFINSNIVKKDDDDFLTMNLDLERFFSYDK